VEYEQQGNDRAKYGTNLLQELSIRLGGKSYGVSNLKNFRQFYLYYPDLRTIIGAYLQSEFQIRHSLNCELWLDEIRHSLNGEFAPLQIAQSMTAKSESILSVQEASRDGFAMSMSVFMYAGFLKSGVPKSLEEAAYIDGCTKMQTFRMIVFPLLKPTTATLVILNAMQFWNDYLLPSLVLGKKPLYTLPLSTYSFYGTYSSDYGLIMAALVLTLLPILILYFFLQKQIIAGMVAGAVK
jgi:hypothetical protein